MKVLNPALKMLYLSIGILIVMSFQFCSKNRIFHQSNSMENYKWFNNKTIIFEPEISNEFINKPLKLFLTVHYIQGFPYKYLHLKIEITDPKGEKKYQDISIPIISDELKYYGDGAGDYWDLDYVVDDELIIETSGKYKIEIKSMMEENPVNFLDEIALTIEEGKK